MLNGIKINIQKVENTTNNQQKIKNLLDDIKVDNNIEQIKNIIKKNELSQNKILAKLQQRNKEAKEKLQKKLQQIGNIIKYKKDFEISNEITPNKIYENINNYIKSDGGDNEIKDRLTELLDGTLSKIDDNNKKKLIKCIMTEGTKIDSDSSKCVNVLLKLKTYYELRF